MSRVQLCLFLLLPLLAQVQAEDVFENFKHVLVPTVPELEQMKNVPTVTAVYYYTKDMSSTWELFSHFDLSAKYLEAYDIKIAVYDCRPNPALVDLCQKEGVDRDVYTYQNGIELLRLELETMFDVNSIMSNLLQLALLHKVPIIQSRLERQEIQKSLVGKQDLIFAYPQAVGTREHRIFMEIAYAFSDVYKFALTTDVRTTVGLRKPTTDLALWVQNCKDTSAEEFATMGDCQSFLYSGSPSLADLANFMKHLSKQNLFRIPEEGTISLFQMADSDRVVYIYMDQTQEEATMKALVHALKFDLKGIAKLVIVNSPACQADAECKSYAEQQGFNWHVPSIGVRQENGKFVFMKETTSLQFAEVRNFLENSLFERGEGESIDEEEEALQSSELGLYSDPESVESQDDQVAGAVFRLQSKKMDLDHVKEFYKDNFYSMARTTDLKMVLFYLIFDALSMAFLRDYGSAAQTLATNFSIPKVLARVECYDATDLCALENITTYPVLRIFRKDSDPMDYTGPLDSKSVIKAVQLLRLPKALKLQKLEEVDSFMKGAHPQNFTQFSPTSVLLLAKEENKEAVRLFNQVSRSLSTSTAFARVHEDLVDSIAEKFAVSVPAVVVAHRADINKPVRTFTEPWNQENLTSFVKQSAIPFIPELTPMNFPVLFARKQPFVILFLNPAEGASKAAKDLITSVAMSEEFQEPIFCWMNAQPQTIGLKILSEYTWTYHLPMVTVVDHKQGEVFNYDPKEMTADGLNQWLKRVLDGSERPSKMLEKGNWVAPGKHYDFLKFIEEDKNLELQRISARLPEEEKVDRFAGNPEDEVEEMHSHSDGYENDDELNPLEHDKEVREELLELLNSRLYHKSRERRETLAKQAVPPIDLAEPRHPHSEL